MGQQQLLLVILVTIIVGIATVVAINTFSSASDSANVDAARNDLLNMAASAQQYYMKPTALGGGGRDFTNIDVNNLGGVPGDISGSSIINENGTYTLSGQAAGTFNVTGVPSTADGGNGNIIISVCPDTSSMSAYSPAGSASAPGC